MYYLALIQDFQSVGRLWYFWSNAIARVPIIVRTLLDLDRFLIRLRQSQEEVVNLWILNKYQTVFF